MVLSANVLISYVLLFNINNNNILYSIFDGILEGPVQQHPFIDATKQLLEKLEGRWVSLALHHVGHHIVKKIFHSLVSMDDKAILVSELSKGIVRLNTKSSGRDIIIECAVKDFLESKVNWSTAISKRKVKTSIVHELWHKGSKEPDKSSPDEKDKKRKQKKARLTK